MLQPADRPSVQPLRDAALVSAAILLVAMVGLCSLYTSARKMQIAAVQSELSQLSATLAAQIDGDLHRTIRSESQAGSPEHRRALVPIARFLGSAHDIIYAYTAVLERGEIHFILQSEFIRRDPEDTLPVDPIGHRYPGSDPQFFQALKTQRATVNPVPVRERSGRRYMSAYAPFYDTQKQFVGVVGVDMWTRDLDRRLSELSRALRLRALSMACLALAIGFVVLRLRRVAYRNQCERILALAEAKRHADAALAADRAKSTFLAIMSHEIRTPMNGVVGLLSLLRSTPLSPQQADYVQTIQAAAETLIRLINDILDYSKIEAGKLDLEQAPFDVRDCIEETLALFASTAAEKGLALEYLAAAEVPEQLVGDRLRLRQILANLISNAVKFTEQGEVFLEVRSESMSPPQGEHGPGSVVLHCTLRDSGIGIPAERIAQLFEPYAQGDAAVSRRFGGTGLGLAICKRIVEQMDGRIAVESTLGQGSVFTFCVRLGWPPGQAAATEPAESAGSASPAGLLLLQLSPLYRRIVASLTAASGKPCRAVDTLAEAEVALAAPRRYDAVLFPAALLHAQGSELLARLKTAAAGQPLRLLLLARIGEPLALPAAAAVQVVLTPIRRRGLAAALAAAAATDSPGGPQAPEPGHGAVQDEGGATPSAALAPPPAPQPAPPPVPHTEPLQILVADDNLINRRVLSVFLEKLGYHPLLAENGRQVLEVCRQQAVDVILMDVQMPELDGHQAALQLRQQLGSASRPWIIALTASTGTEDVAAARAAGMNDFLTKPLLLDTLTAALQRATQHLQHGAADAAAPLPPVG